MPAGRPSRGGVSELKWTSEIVRAHKQWHHLVALPDVTSFDLEYQVSPMRGNLGTARRHGYPRIDAVLRHGDGAISLFEAKLETSPQALMGAVGQLLYYRTILKRTEKVTAARLVLAAPIIPPLVGEMLEECCIPISLLIVREDAYEGLVPRFCHATRH